MADHKGGVIYDHVRYYSDNFKTLDELCPDNDIWHFTIGKAKAKKIGDKIKFIAEKCNNPEFLTDMKNLTFFIRGFDAWNITELVRKHKITGLQLFLAMMIGSIPTGMGAIEFQSLSVNEYIQKFHDEAEYCKDSAYIEFDYCNGVRVKNCFAKDTMANKTVIDISRFGGSDAVTRLAMLFATYYIRE